MVLLLVLVWWARRERSRWAGAWLGMAIAIKMSPALLVAFVVSQRRWRECAVVLGSAGLAVAGSCLAMGGRALVFPGTVAAGFLPGGQYHGLDVPIDFYGNESLAHLALGLTGNPGGGPLRLGPGATALQLVLLAVMLGAWALATRRLQPDRSLAALLVVMVVAPTFAWEHHLLFLFFSLVVLAEATLRQGITPGSVLAWVLIAWLCEGHTTFALPDGAVSDWLGPLSRMPKIVPMLGVFVPLVRDGFRPLRAS